MTEAGKKLIEAIQTKPSNEVYTWLDEILRDDLGNPSPKSHIRESPNSTIVWVHHFVDRPKQRQIEDNLWLLLKHGVTKYGDATNAEATLYVEGLLSVFEEIEELERFKHDLYRLVEERPFEKLVYGQARNLFLVMLNVYVSWLDVADVQETDLSAYFKRELPFYSNTPFFQVALRYFQKKIGYKPYFDFCTDIVAHTTTEDDAYWLVDATEEYFDYTDGNMMLYLSQWIKETNENQRINTTWWASYQSKLTKWLERVKDEVKTKQRIVPHLEYTEMVYLLVTCNQTNRHQNIAYSSLVEKKYLSNYSDNEQTIFDSILEYISKKIDFLRKETDVYEAKIGGYTGIFEDGKIHNDSEAYSIIKAFEGFRGKIPQSRLQETYKELVA
jgi:hypothetical protein